MRNVVLVYKACWSGRIEKGCVPGCEEFVMIFLNHVLVLEVLEGGQCFFCCPYWSLQSFPILLCGSSEPDCDGCVQDGFSDRSVKLAEHLLWQTILPQLLQKVHPLLDLFKDGVDVGLPFWVLRNGSS